MKKPPIGSLVVIQGDDLCGELNSDGKPHVAPFRAVGWVREWGKRQVVLDSMQWTTVGGSDWGAFPTGCIVSVEQICKDVSA